MCGELLLVWLNSQCTGTLFPEKNQGRGGRPTDEVEVQQEKQPNRSWQTRNATELASRSQQGSYSGCGEVLRIAS